MSQPLSAFSLDHKLTGPQIERIRRLARSGRYGTQREIGKRFGVSQTTVSKIAQGKKTI